MSAGAAVVRTDGQRAFEHIRPLPFDPNPHHFLDSRFVLFSVHVFSTFFFDLFFLIWFFSFRF